MLYLLNLLYSDNESVHFFVLESVQQDERYSQQNILLYTNCQGFAIIKGIFKNINRTRCESYMKVLIHNVV